MRDSANPIFAKGSKEQLVFRGRRIPVSVNWIIDVRVECCIWRRGTRPNNIQPVGSCVFDWYSCGFDNWRDVVPSPKSTCREPRLSWRDGNGYERTRLRCLHLESAEILVIETWICASYLDDSATFDVCVIGERLFTPENCKISTT